MGKWIEQSFFKGRSPNSQKSHEEMFNIPGHKGNANQNHTKIPPRSNQNDYHQENNLQILARIWVEKEPSYTVGRNLN
jgi:hypothetical protein